MLQIVIPTCNAAEPLSRLLAQVTGERVIVSDSGSDDDTLRVAIAAGAVIAAGKPGRGSQLKLGAELAVMRGGEGDWFLFLHADSVMPDGWRSEVARAMEGTAPRYFPLSFGASGFQPWLMEKLVAFRNLGWALPYGDQGLLVSRTDYLACGGYPDWPLFEDVDIAQRLTGLQPMRGHIRTDVGKYEAEGYWARGLRNYRLLRDFRRGVSPHELAERYQ